MNSRVASLAFAFLLAVSAAVTAAPAACCVPGESSERALIAVDCCSTMVECPLQLKVAGAVVQAEGPSLAIGAPALAPEPPAAAELFSSASLEPDDLSYAGPPLYRLHAQLLI